MAVPGYITQILLDHPFALWLLTDGASPASDSNPSLGGTDYISTGIHGTIFWKGAGLPTPLNLPVVAFGQASGGILLPSIPANLNRHGMTFEAFVYAPLDTRSVITTGTYEQTSTRLAPSFNTTLILYTILGTFPNIGLALTSGVGQLNWFVEGWLNGQASAFSTVAFSSWTHIAASYQGAGSPNRTIYVNGTAVGIDTTGTTADFTSAMRIGEDERWSAYDTVPSQSGIAAAGIYDYALSAQQIQNHYQAWLQGVNEFYIPITGLQPPTIPSVIGGISAWTAETYAGGGKGTPPAVGSLIVAGVQIGNPTFKYWVLDSTVNPSSG